MKVYNGIGFINAGSSVNGTSSRLQATATEGQTTFVTSGYDSGFVDVYLNGIKIIRTTDFLDTDGTNIVLVNGATAGDEVSIVAYGTFLLSNHYSAGDTDLLLADKQDTLVSGTSIKTVGGSSLLGSGNIPVPTNVSDLTNDSGYVTSSGNTVIGTDGDINTSGSTIIDNLYMTDGVITSHGTRVLTASDLSAYTQSQVNTLINNIDALPSQTGNAGKLLGTDGTTASWQQAGAVDDIFYENAQVITSNYTLAAGRNAMTAGSITINNGVTITISDGSSWTIV